MGISSIWHWLVVLAIVVIIFGTKKIPGLGKDLGEAIKGFKEGIKSAEDNHAAPTQVQAQAMPEQIHGQSQGQTIEGEVKEKTKS